MNIVDEVIKKYGGVKNVQAKLGYGSPMAVYNWRSRGIPTAKVIDIHLETGIPLRKLQSK